MKTINADQPKPSEAGRLLLKLLAERGPLAFQELRRVSGLGFPELVEGLLGLCRLGLLAEDAASEVRFALTGAGRESLGLPR